ncbi:MAG: PEP-utilizing enzyme [Patescibacteria group bacterium]
MKTLEELEEKLKEAHFSPEGGRAAYYLYHHLIIEQYSEEHPEWKLLSYFKGGAAIIKNHIVKWFFLVADENEFINAATLFSDDKGRIKKLEEFLYSIRDELLGKLSIADVKALSDKELGVLAFEYCSLIRLMFKMSGTIRVIDRGIIALIKKDFPKEKVDEILRKFSTNDIPSIAVEEELELLKLAAESDNIEEQQVSERLSKIYEKFCFTALGYYNEKAKSLKYYKEKLLELKSGNPKEGIEDITKRQQEEAKGRNEFIKTFPIKYQEVAEISGFSTWLKDYFKYSINQVEHKATAMFAEIAERAAVSIDDVMDCSPQEFIACAEGKPVDFDRVRERRTASVIIFAPPILATFDGKDAEYIEEKYLISKNLRDTEFKGRIASPGHAKAAACIVLGPKDFHKMKKGNVLVVINTSPDFVPIMHLASAIVSEEGGLTSHVSVVSREFGIPSVVGIRSITEVIKDGDMVEVDAEKGTVKILR